MSKEISGKKPIVEKKAKSAKDLFKPRNLLDIPADIQAEFEKKGLEGRWLDSKQMADNGNVHKNHWQIYKRDTATVSAEAGMFGLPPDGTVRRGTLVLGFRSKEIGDGHREVLKERRENLKASVKKQGAELRAEARRGGLSERIFDETEID